MKIYTIPQKQSNTGSIHDLNSQHWDRAIKFRKGTQYAVILAAYYVDNSGADGYTTHCTEKSTIVQAAKLHRDNYSYAIIDTTGKRYAVNGDTLCCID